MIAFKLRILNGKQPENTGNDNHNKTEGNEQVKEGNSEKELDAAHGSTETKLQDGDEQENVKENTEESLEKSEHNEKQQKLQTEDQVSIIPNFALSKGKIDQSVLSAARVIVIKDINILKEKRQVLIAGESIGKQNDLEAFAWLRDQVQTLRKRIRPYNTSSKIVFDVISKGVLQEKRANSILTLRKQESAILESVLLKLKEFLEASPLKDEL